MSERLRVSRLGRDDRALARAVFTLLTAQRDNTKRSASTNRSMSSSVVSHAVIHRT